MSGLKQSKRVSWAPDVKLCQVRLFLSEDAPSQSGSGAQDGLQAKASWLWHAAATGSDDSPPPGFEAPHPAYCFRKETSQIPLIKWQCPPSIILNPEWLVVSGEESEEVSVQCKRQLGVFEALYPRQSSIPLDPFVSSDAQDPNHDDLRTPLIPITTIEEEEDSPERSDPVQLQQPDELPDSEAPCILPEPRSSVEVLQWNSVPDPPRVEKPVPGAEPDVVAAASAAFTAIMRSSEEGSLVDRDLLIRILSNPSLLEKLVSEYEASKQTLPTALASAPPPPPPPLPLGINLIAPMSASPTAHIYPLPNVAASRAVNRLPSPVPAIQNAPPVKDANYYKSLIQQHGEERQDAVEPNESRFRERHDYQSLAGVNGVDAIGHGSTLREVKLRIPKPCVYFNSPRGCRHGASCLYQHDASSQQTNERPRGAKRIRLDRGIAGRN